VKLSTNIRYAFRALCDIADRTPGTPVQIKGISERQGISARYIEQIFQKLKKAGIIRSVRGPTGGYLLARNPEHISIGDVIRAVEGKDIQLVSCLKRHRGSIKVCDRWGKCAVSGVWGEASKMLMAYFNSVSVLQICDETKKKEVEIKES
jgi:Rrf2 family iron-sulfur cluster assembly transcriptional regulator